MMMQTKVIWYQRVKKDFRTNHTIPESATPKQVADEICRIEALSQSYPVGLWFGNRLLASIDCNPEGQTFVRIVPGMREFVELPWRR